MIIGCPIETKIGYSHACCTVLVVAGVQISLWCVSGLYMDMVVRSQRTGKVY